MDVLMRYCCVRRLNMGTMINSSQILDQYCHNISSMNCEPFFASFSQNRNLTFNTIFVIMLIILFIIGVTGNICVIMCVVLFKNMRTISHVFLLNLAFSDLLVFLLCEPFTVSYIFDPYWKFGDVFCRIRGTFQGTSVGVSIFTLTSICIERYIVIVGKGFNMNRFHFRHLIIWVICIWLLAFIITSPLLTAYTLISPMKNDLYYCTETWNNKRSSKLIFTLAIFFKFYLIPLLFMLILYSKVAIHLSRSTALLQSLQNRTQLHQQSTTTMKYDETHHRDSTKRTILRNVDNARQRISKLLLILTVLFAILWLPYHILNISFDSYDIMKSCNTTTSNNNDDDDNNINTGEACNFASNITEYSYLIAQLLSYINNAINPICTLVISKKFRIALRRLKRCDCRDYNSVTGSSTMGGILGSHFID